MAAAWYYTDDAQVVVAFIVESKTRREIFIYRDDLHFHVLNIKLLLLVMLFVTILCSILSI